jgi:hypothetical protein
MRRCVLCLLLPLVSVGQWAEAAKASESTKSFVAPKIKDVRLDWCRHWARDCGKPAAELFCRQMGFSKAVRFSIDPDIGARGIATVVFGDGKLCRAPYCSGFRIITCALEAAVEATPDASVVARPPASAETAAAPPTVPLPEIPTKQADSQSNKKKVTVATKPIQKPSAKLAMQAISRKIPSLSNYQKLKPSKVTVTWVRTLRSLNFYPEGAALYRCGSGDCSVSSSTDFEIDANSAQDVWLNYSVAKVPHAERALWQVSESPFALFAGTETELHPAGLLASGETGFREGGFSFQAAAIKAKLKGGGAILHVRIVPMAGQGGTIVGRPSNVMRIYFGAKMPPQEPVKIYAKSEVPGSAPNVELVSLVFEPFKQIERWPPGCQTWEEKYGEEENFFEEVGDFFSGAWDFASGAYQWAKDQVVALASALTFDAIPKDVFKYALDAALVSMGIPPDIPNLGQMMDEGAEGLAKEFAKAAVSQIPSGDLAVNLGNLAADISVTAAANMAEEELRDHLRQELETRSRQAIAQAAEELKRQIASQNKDALCEVTEFHPVFRVKVRNRGSKREKEVKINASASPVYKGGAWSIDLMPNESITLVAVGTPLLPGGPYSHPLLTEKQRYDEDLERWYRDILHRRSTSIKVEVSGALNCLGGDPTSQFCERKMVTAHQSPEQMVTQSYSYGP